MSAVDVVLVALVVVVFGGTLLRIHKRRGSPLLVALRNYFNRKA
jgi:hypothetical protein